MASRHQPETLRSFLQDVSEGLPELVRSSAAKRDQAIQQLEDALGVSGLIRWVDMVEMEIGIRWNQME